LDPPARLVAASIDAGRAGGRSATLIFAPGIAPRFGFFDGKYGRNATRQHIAGSTMTASMTAPTRVLLVEDDPAYARLIAGEIETRSNEFSTATVSSVASAVRDIERQNPGALLLDLGLPDSQGIATLERVQDALPRDTPIIVLTAHDDARTAREVMQRGAEDYLVKGSTNGEAIARALHFAIERSTFRRRTAPDTIRHTEAQVRQAQKMEAIGRLAGGIAHDFNNVLAAIFGYVDLLLDNFGRDDPLRADVLEIKYAAERAAGLTRQLLAFSRRQVLQPRRINLNEVITGMAPLLGRLIGSDVELTLDLEPGIGEVQADPGQMQQVLMNLAANARDAMPEGGRMSVMTRNEDVNGERAKRLIGLAPGQFVCLSVADTGGGIPDEIQRQIFEPFFTTKEYGRGTGLGLATVYGIVKQSGGWIYVKSEPGHGARFTIYLPRLPTSSP
jgi:signal transduction histidine kinase